MGGIPGNWLFTNSKNRNRKIGSLTIDNKNLQTSSVAVVFIETETYEARARSRGMWDMGSLAS